MDANEYKAKLENSINLQLIVAGLAGLIDHEGYTFHEVMDLLEETKRNTFPALMEMSREESKNA
ncbi:hypothetical protein [Oceanobacillus kimchii]|uniref:hypothetical protein n=1 Tax=Oceanobacillus kimchii TaxID=746691 RepID=UPI003B016DEF